MKSHVLRALKKTPNRKKTLKFHLELNFNNFQKRKKWKSFKLIAMIFLPLGLTLLDLIVNTISELVLTIILYLFLLYILLEVEY